MGDLYHEQGRVIGTYWAVPHTGADGMVDEKESDHRDDGPYPLVGSLVPAGRNPHTDRGDANGLICIGLVPKVMITPPG